LILVVGEVDFGGDVRVVWWWWWWLILVVGEVDFGGG
jgi:hypothetical protein